MGSECSFYRQLSRKLATRRLSEFIRWIVLLLIFIYVVKVYFDYSTSYIIDKNFADVVPGPSSANLLINVCSNETKVCYGVMDFPSDEAGQIVQRVIYVKGFEKEADTSVRLKPPNGLSFHNSDSKLWEIDHMNLTAQYTAILCLFPFVVKSVPALENTKDSARILDIGLGGGGVDMFLHTIKPKWKIDVYELDPLVKKLAHEWFGVVDDEYRRTYVMDGLVGVEKAVQKGLKYDAVLIDACDTDKIMPCPAKNFLKPHNLENIKAVLTSTGCLAINVLVLDQEHLNERVSMIEHRMLRVFPTCLVIRMNIEYNVVIACLPYALESSSSQKTKEMWKQGLEDILKKFDFNFDRY